MTDSRIDAIKDCRILSLRELELVGGNEDIASFQTLISIFPNIEKLICENLVHFSLKGMLENFKRLSYIRTENFAIETMLFVKLPSLKVLDVDYLSPAILDFAWEQLALNCENIEEILIEYIGHAKLNASVKIQYNVLLRNLKHFKNLKKCKIICTPPENTVNADHDDNFNENFPEHPFYKVLIDLIDKKIQLSDYFERHCIEEVNILREEYKDCDITQL
jgi:hypothetical protein